MHFLHVMPSVRRESGGPAEGLRLILAGYRELGHTAEVLCLESPVEDPEDFPVVLHEAGSWNHKYKYSSVARAWLRDNAKRFNGIIIHGLWQYCGLLALQELAGRYPYVLFTHGMLDPWFNRSYPAKYLKKLPYWLFVERRVLKAAQKVLFTSSVEAELARRSFPLAHFESEIVPYGTYGPPKAGKNAQEQSSAFYQETGLEPGEPYLLYAGRIHEKKGCDLLIAAYATVSAEEPLPRLMMAGPDQAGLSTTLKEAARSHGIADRVLWPGMLTSSAKWIAFSKAEAFILPSHQENFGIAVAEALSCSTPVLISDQVNIHADVAKYQGGYVEPDTLEGTVSLLRRWARTSPAERLFMRARSSGCWLEKFDSAGTSRAIVNIFS